MFEIKREGNIDMYDITVLSGYWELCPNLRLSFNPKERLCF